MDIMRYRKEYLKNHISPIAIYEDIWGTFNNEISGGNYSEFLVGYRGNSSGESGVFYINNNTLHNPNN